MTYREPDQRCRAVLQDVVKTLTKTLPERLGAGAGTDHIVKAATIDRLCQRPYDESLSSRVKQHLRQDARLGKLRLRQQPLRSEMKSLGEPPAGAIESRPRPRLRGPTDMNAQSGPGSQESFNYTLESAASELMVELKCQHHQQAKEMASRPRHPQRQVQMVEWRKKQRELGKIRWESGVCLSHLQDRFLDAEWESDFQRLESLAKEAKTASEYVLIALTLRPSDD